MPADAVAGPARNSRGRVKWARRTFFLLVAAAIVVSLVLDSRLKHGPHLGFAPEQTTLTVAVADAPAFWWALARTDTARALSPESLAPFYDLQLTLRKLTGIRPTVGRLFMWFGPAIVASSSEQGWTFCVRPGLLFRARLAASRILGEGAIPPGRAVWRDGFWIVASNSKLLDTLKQLEPEAREPPLTSNELLAIFTSPVEGKLRISASNGLPAVGTLAIAAQPCEHIDVPEESSDPPLLAVYGANAADALNFLDTLVAGSPFPELIYPAPREVRAALPETWPGEHDGAVASITDLDTADFVALPQMAIATHSSSGTVVNAPLDAIPYEWSTRPGWQLPWLGERFTICSAASGEWSWITSTAALMESSISETRFTASEAADWRLELDWRKAAAVAKTLTERAAGNELIPRMDIVDAQERILPWISAAGECGTLALSGHVTGNGLAVEGYLAGRSQGVHEQSLTHGEGPP